MLIGVEVLVEMLRMEVAEPPEASVTLVGLNVLVGPARKTVAVRLTLPLNPLRLFNVIVLSTELPA